MSSAPNPTKATHSFAWLNLTQFLGALNDNVFKLLLVFLLIDQAGPDHRTAVITAASGVFVLPFLLFAHIGGILADRFSKRNVVISLKLAEIAIMALGCVAVYLGHAWLLYGVLFLMCTQSALFGPSKYGIVPELVPSQCLSKANSLLEGLTYLAIIIGTFIPSWLLLNVFDRNYLFLAISCAAIAVAGTLAAARIEVTPAAGTRRRPSLLFVADIFRTLAGTRKDRDLFLTILGSAFFLFIGAFIQQNTLLYGQDILGMGWIESGYLFPMAALGIGVGALLAGRLSGRNIEFGVVPLGAAGLTVTTLLLALAPASRGTVLTLIFFVGLSSGLFIVPLHAFVQYRSPRARLGEILAASSFLSFLGVALSAALLYLLNRVIGLGPAACFAAAGILTATLTLIALLALPDFFIRFVILLVTRCLYRIRTVGLDHVPMEGGALLVANHVTWVDALLIAATQQRRIRFIMAREIYDVPGMRLLCRLMKVIPVSPSDPPRRVMASLHEAGAALDDGYLVCIFAEGALTRNGNMRAFRPGMEVILRNRHHPVIPIYIGGAWGSIFSYYSGRLLRAMPRRLPYPVTLLFGSPLPPSCSTEEAEHAVSDLCGQWFNLQKSADRTLPIQFAKTARRFWFRTAVADTTGQRLSFGKTLIAALALAREIDRLAPGQQKIGLLFPASVGGVLANLAVSLSGRIPVNLNFTASPEAQASAIRQCRIQTILSSRAFLQKLDGFKTPEGIVDLGSLASRISFGTRALAVLKACTWPARFLPLHEKAGADDVATIIFSSGSTAEPKGIALSHHNILSNIEAFCMVMRLEPQDRMCCVLPFFHSFGFTCCLWGPAVAGFFAAYHPNPLDGAKIAELVRQERLTLLLATPTFLLSYLRRASKEDLSSLRAVLTGAEKLRTKIADAFEERFGIRPLEGYGATELSPVASLCLPDVTIDGVRHRGSKEGSIGHPIPGVTLRTVHPESGAPQPRGTEGLLMAKGPNVMLGYLDRPEQTREVLKDGWYATGDIAVIDKDGFVFLKDRVSRYSKIGGEMVPHLAIEDQYLQAIGAMNQSVLVTSAPDEKKGEVLVVFHTPEAGPVERLQEIIARSELPNLWKPRKENYMAIDALPALGSGKMDLKRVRALAEEFVRNRPQRASGDPS